jgi:hypothetical protein
MYSLPQLRLPNGIFLSGFPINILYMLIMCHAYYMLYPPQPFRYYYPNNILWRVQIMKPFMM